MSARALRLTSVLGLLISTLFFSLSPASATTPSTAPTSIVVTPGPGTLTVAWAAPAYLNGGTITAYSIDTSTTGTGSWGNVSNSIPGTTYSYTINSLTPGTNYFIRISAIGTGGTSPYGYPWTKIYSTSTATRSGSAIIYDNGYGIGGSDTATALANSPFSRVKYRLQFDLSGTTNYAEADMAKWDTTTFANSLANANETSVAATVTNLRVPSVDTLANEFNVHTNVSDLTVVSSTSSLNVSGKQGRLEIWPWNYGPGLSGLTNIATPNAATYDFDDSNYLSSSYGSFQVHNISDGVTILAWNDPGSTPDMGIGNSPGTHPDWTFQANYTNNSAMNNFHLGIFVNIPTAPTALLTTSVSLSAPTSSSFRTATTITANTSTAGKVTFYAFGKRIPGCINVATSANVATCNWKPSVHGQIPLTASFFPTIGLNSNTQLSSPVTTSRRINAR